MHPAGEKNGVRVPLAEWEPVHPAAIAFADGALDAAPLPGAAQPRAAELAAALADLNRRWRNPIDERIDEWLRGAEVVVTGQQPGLLGGPLLTLVKACAVAAEVARRRAAGRRAVGFLWLASSDDDLPEMGWARLAAGEELLEAREQGWARGQAIASAAVLTDASAGLLDRAEDGQGSRHAGDAIALARECYRPGETLADATGRFLGSLLAGSGLVLVDATLPALARAAASAVVRVLERLDDAFAAVADRGAEFRERDWPVPLPSSRRLPLFRLESATRARMADSAAARGGALRDLARDPARLTPNVWLRPIVQDAALGTSESLLGGGELAYHLQARDVWALAGVPRPRWRLRPHVTVVTGAERRLADRLALDPSELLDRRLPDRLTPGAGVRRALRALERTLETRLDRLDAVVREELPDLSADLEATRSRLVGSVRWLEERSTRAATRRAEIEGARLLRLRTFLRPGGKAQERELSVLAPLLRLGLDWPGRLIDSLALDGHEMQLLFWREGGAW